MGLAVEIHLEEEEVEWDRGHHRLNGGTKYYQILYLGVNNMIRDIKIFLIIFVIFFYYHSHSNELKMEDLRKNLDENVMKLRNDIEAYGFQFWSSIPIPDYIEKTCIKNNTPESNWDLYFEHYLKN
jgi:hypothetical protein